jgi:plasmid replication initiation protein
MKDGRKIRSDREMIVVKHNDLIQARYNLTTQQQKIVAFAISKIRPYDKPGQWYEISIEELCNACGLIIDDTGYYYKSIKDDMRKLTNRLWIKLPNKTELTFSWLSDAVILPLNGTVQVKFHEQLEDYLFLNMAEGHYTQYQFGNISPFRNKYSIRLFELLRMKVFQDELDTKPEIPVSFDIDELREELGATSYQNWPEFNRCVIKKAVDEINQYSDIFRIMYEPIKEGKRTKSIRFIVSRPSGTQIYIAHQAAKDRQKMQRKPTKKTIEKREKQQKLAAAKKEVERQLASGATYEELSESARRLLEEIEEPKITWGMGENE